MRKYLLVASLLFASLTARSQEASPEESFRRAADFAEAGKHEEAIPLFLLALRAFPDDPTILWNLGISNAELGNHTQALSYWNSYLAQRQTDWRAQAKLVQTYQAIGDIKSRGTAHGKLLAMRRGAEPGSEIAQAQAFCREQMLLSGRRVMVFEAFEPAGDRKIFYTFHVLTPQGEESWRVSLGSYELTNKIAWETGQLPRDKRLYHLDRYEGRSHATLGFFEALPDYDSTRQLFLQALEGKAKPLSSSTTK